MENFEVHMDINLPLRDVVFNTLRQAILRGKLKPGERLMEIQLANKLGVSRTPVREALHKLEQEGLVLTTPRKGAEVADISAKSLQDVLEVRQALEALAIQLACDKMTEEQIRELEQAAQNFRDILDSDDVTQIAEADVAFHDVIIIATDNQKLIQLLNNLREQMYRFRVEHLKNKAYHPQLLEEHKEMIEYIKERRKDEATKIIRQHVNNQVNAVMGMINTKK
ncbi:MAG: GntR family transcriptional regulator [Lachnospiraceae bacterium]